MALMLAICSPQPNWMPRKPKLMFHICQKLLRGFSMFVLTHRSGWSRRPFCAKGSHAKIIPRYLLLEEDTPAHTHFVQGPEFSCATVAIRGCKPNPSPPASTSLAPLPSSRLSCEDRTRTTETHGAHGNVNVSQSIQSISLS